MITTSFAATMLASGPLASLPAQDDLQRALGEIAELRAQNRAITERNDALATKVARLEEHASEDGSWLTERRAQEIRSIVTDVLADGATRDSLATDGMTAGWDASKGYVLASADGNFSLNIRGDVQFRWDFNRRDIAAATAATGSPAAGSDEDTTGFELRRVRFAFIGSVIDPSWTYDIKLANNRAATSGNSTYVDDAYLQKSLDGGHSIKVGQFKLPFLREDQVSSTGQLAAERSLVNEVFSVSRSQGISFGVVGDALRAEVSYGDAMRANATAPTTGAGAAGGIASGQNTGFNADTTDYAFAGRVEFKPVGEWKQFKDMQSYRGESTGVLFGVAGYIEQAAAVAGTTATPDTVWSATADATVDLGGASILVYGVFRDVTLQAPQAVRGGGTSDSLAQWGAVVQGGVFATDSVELFARYELGDTDTDQFRTAATALEATGEHDSLLTVGANWWPAGPKMKYVKITADVGYAFDPLVDFNGSGAGYLVDYTAAGGTGSDGQWLVRTQLQLMF